MPEIQSTTSRLVAQIQRDPVVTNCIKNAMQTTIIDKLTLELKGYSITSRNLADKGHYEYGVDPTFRNPGKDMRSCLTAVLKIQAYRDRVCEIQIHLIDMKRRLDSATGLATRHIYEVYGMQVKARGTGEHQKAFISTVLSHIAKRLELVEAQLDQVKAVLDNLDKAHFAYRAVAEIGIKLVDRLEGGRSATIRA